LSYSVHAIKYGKAEASNSILSTSQMLNEDSVVIDVGGETGIWSMKMFSKYKPKLYIFEPHPGAVRILYENVKDKKANIFQYGLGSKNFVTQLSDSGMGSSIFNSSPDFEQSKKFDIEIRDIKEVFEDLSLESVDLIKINIEGGEYDLVPRMIETGIVNKCKVIRIQFHDWIPDAFAMRKKIVKELSKTHEVEWSFPLVWESWIRKDIAAIKNVSK